MYIFVNQDFHVITLYRIQLWLGRFLNEFYHINLKLQATLKIEYISKMSSFF